MNEAETRAEHIDPALAAAGWGKVEGSRIRREFGITPGPIEGRGRRGKPLTADYVLVYRNTPLAVVEAKAWHEAVTEGVGQAKDYAGRMALRFAYATNGQGIWAIDMRDGTEGAVPAFPTPDALWDATFSAPDPWRDRFAAIPYEDKGGSHPARYYQEIAIARVLEAVAQGRNRILLTLATGTGKTFIAFQIAWKLFQARWNLSGTPDRRPRILFLADRNLLANQAFNAFSAFPEDALVRIAPDEVRRKGKVPTNGSVFFTIFQTFLTGPVDDATGLPAAYFGDYPRDFFDFIVIDECHRGGANDEGTWRAILDYFAPAVQLGLTATPKRTDNVDTYAYFGDPVYVYSLKNGINDGFLTPFRVRQVQTTIDEYVYADDDRVLEGQVEYGKVYGEGDFNRTLVIDERERARVRIFLAGIGPTEKTLVFCASQAHALLVRDLVNQDKAVADPNYCQRVTADEGERGEQHLRDFQDNEKTIPTVLTTSQKLSTGVDARNVRHIVLMRPIRSMIEFKQIIGRGTRLHEGKDYFTIWDFVRAHRLFADPEWDGEPVAPDACPECGASPCRCERPGPQPCPTCHEWVCMCPKVPCARCGQRPCVCVCPACGERPCVCPPGRAKVQLADGKERRIQHMMSTTFWHPDGTPMSAFQFMQALFGTLPAFFADEAQLRALWSDPETRRRLLEGLAEKGFGAQQLREMARIIDAEGSDLFDVLRYVAWARAPRTREERAQQAQAAIRQHFDSPQQAFLEFVLGHYVAVGVEELGLDKLAPLLRLRFHDSMADATRALGPADKIREAFAGFQRFLYVG